MNKCVCIHEIIQLVIMEMKTTMKNRSHRYDVNRPRSIYEHKYNTYKKRLTMMMLICSYKATPKQHLKLNS